MDYQHKKKVRGRCHAAQRKYSLHACPVAEQNKRSKHYETVSKLFVSASKEVSYPRAFLKTFYLQKKFKLTVEDSLKHTPATLCTREVISLLDRHQMSPLHTRVQNHVSLRDSIDYLFNSSFWLRGHLRLRSCTSAKQNGL